MTFPTLTRALLDWITYLYGFSYISGLPAYINPNFVLINTEDVVANVVYIQSVPERKNSF